jgi:hypothetical protein
MLIFCEFAQFVDGQMEEQHNYNYVEREMDQCCRRRKKGRIFYWTPQ